MSEGRLEMHLALHRLDQSRDNGKPEPDAAIAARIGSADLRERIEQVRLGVFGNARTRVAHDQRDTLAVRTGARLDQHRARLRELDGVARQVEEDLPQPAGIANHVRREIGMHHARNVEPRRVRARRQQLGHILHQLIRIERRDIERNVARFHAREIEHVVEQVQQARARFANGDGIVALGRQQLGLFQQRRHAENAIERRADLVADRRREAMRGIQRLMLLRRGEPNAFDRRGHPPAASRLVDALRRNVSGRQRKRRTHSRRQTRQRACRKHHPVGANRQRRSGPALGDSRQRGDRAGFHI